MEERFLARARGIIDDGGPRVTQQSGNAVRGKPGRIECACAALCREDVAEMAFAAARGTLERERRRRPVGPTVEPGDRFGIARREQEVGASQCRPVTELERQLRAHRTGRWSSGS